MARMSIDDKVCRDPRITVLASLIGWSRRETLGCLIADVWAICYDQQTHLVSPRIIDAAAGHEGFAKAMVECELATEDRSGKVAIVGAKKRIKYLTDKQSAGQQGGLKSAESRRKAPKQTSSNNGSTPQAARNPNPNASVPDPVAVPDPASSEKNSATPTAGGSRSRKPRPSEPTADERASALFVLRKLTDRSGVRYSGTPEHVRLIVGRLRDGVTEADLRKVIGYCAVELDWQDNPDMAKYLRPETLFGPKSISKYLDAARDWFVKQGLELEPRPLLEVVQ